jgi:hypothetical protein
MRALGINHRAGSASDEDEAASDGDVDEAVDN